MRRVRFAVHEHDRLDRGKRYATTDGGEATFEEGHLEALGRYHDRSGTSAFALRHNGVQLRNYVGYLRVGHVSLEIYPKLGRDGPARDWRGLLLHMLRVVLGVRIAVQEKAPLRSRAGDLFEILVRRFLDATEALVREGLARSYREVEENSTAFRGRLVVRDHLRVNFIRRERLYVAYEVHDTDNLVNRVLHRALERVARTASSHTLVHQAESILVDFPDVSPGPIRAAEWPLLDRLDRRTIRYREALTLARMILRDERPDLRWGDREVLAVLFDMNALFEAYVAQAFRGIPGCHIRAQSRRLFWNPDRGPANWLKPDVLLYARGAPETPIVVDTKWKVPRDVRPDDNDLRQVFAYLHAFDGRRGILIYPRATSSQTHRWGTFLDQERHGEMAFLELYPDGSPNLNKVREQLAAIARLEHGGVNRHSG